MLRDLPLDAWAEVFSHFDESVVLDRFAVLEELGVFSRGRRLDTFWQVQTKLRRRAERKPFEDFPRLAELTLGNDGA